MTALNYTIRSPKLSDIDRCYEIESLSYASDEAATREKIATRIKNYPEGFMLIEDGNTIIGFINSGSTDHVVMSDDQFKELIGHDPQGQHNVIMSVVVHPDFRGQGFSVVLMENYILRMKALNKKSIHLMCKEKYIRLYEKSGFNYLQQSGSSYGGVAWHEMSIML